MDTCKLASSLFRFFPVAFSLAIFCPNLSGQPLFQLKSTDAGTSRLLPEALSISPTGLIAVTGGADNRRAFVQMLNDSGVGKWAKAYGPTNHTHFDDFVFTPAGNMIALMNHPSGGAERINIYSIDTNGVVLWEKQWTVPNIEYQRLTAIRAVDGGYVAVGFATQSQSGDGKGIILKIDESGNLLWHRIIDTGVILEVYDFCSDELGNLYVPAYVYNSHNVTLFKFSPNGDLLWVRYFDAPGNDSGFLLFTATGTNGDLLLVGQYNDYTVLPAKNFGWAVNIDREDGTVRWSKRYQPANESARFDKMIPRHNGHWLVSLTNTGLDSACLFNAHLLELDSDGQVVWAKKYAARKIGDLFEMPDEQLLLLALWPDNDRTTMALMKTDPEGYFPGCCSPTIPVIASAQAGVLQSNGTVGLLQPLLPFGQGIYVYDYDLVISPLCEKTADFELPTHAICAGAYLTGLKVQNPVECAEYVWSIEGGSPTQSNFLHLDSVQFCSPGVYNITLQIEPEKCNESKTEILEVTGCGSFTPNAFTPNGDGINDLFRPAVCSDVKAYEFSVYNRWGQLIFQTIQTDVAWDGTADGHPAPMDVYAWRAIYHTVQNGQETPISAQGDVTLLR